MTSLIICAFPTDRLSGGAARPWTCGGVLGGVCQHPPEHAPLAPPVPGKRTPATRKNPVGSKQCRNECAVRDIVRMPQVGGAGDGAVGEAVSWAAHRRTVNLRRTASPPTESSQK